MMDLDAKERTRLENLIGMLGSDHDGERANAAAFITAMAKKHKVTVVELVMSPTVIYRDRIVEKTVYRDRPGAASGSHGYSRGYDSGQHGSPPGGLLRRLRDLTDQQRDFLSAWEVDFVDDVLWNSEYDLSQAQRNVILRILAKVDRKTRQAERDADLI